MARKTAPGLFLPLLTVVLVAACASQQPGVREKLDPRTGVTVTFDNTPLILYRETPARAAFARNYVHMGPIQVNRSGDFQFFLWLSAWTTMQSPDPADQQDGLESIFVFADGEPLSLELAGWTPGAIGTSEPVYLKPVASAVDAYYRVTADQIRLIAEAEDLRIQTSGSNSQEFGLWDEQRQARRELLEFLNRTLF